MKSVPFEEFGISECQFDGCTQRFNQDSIKIAVWLYGVVFLHEEKQFEIADKIFLEATEHEKLKMDQETVGFIGITCPKCLKTSLYKKSIKEIKEFKTFLSSWSLPDKKDKDTAQSSNWMTELISMNLRYYFPFDQSGTLLKASCIYEYSYDEQIADFEFSQEAGMAVIEADKDLQNTFCTYSIKDEVEPLGNHIDIYWFDNEKIAEITRYENEKEGSIFPRYHYSHDLMERIDSLLKYNYFDGKQIDQVLVATEELMKTDIGKYEFYYRRKERIEKQKRQNEIDFETPKSFFEILTSNPVELKPFMGEPLKNCDYLWIKRNPFSGKGMPIDFSFGNQPDEYAEIAAELKSIHEKMVDLVRENYHKQYVQEFLKDNLIDFLEEYEEFIRSNTFSYAAVWELKESYLKGLYKNTNKGLRDEKPCSIHSEGEGWRIRFENVTKSYKNDLGFMWIYMALLHQGKPVYYSSLNDTYDTKPAQVRSDDEVINYMKYKEELSINHGGNLTKQYYSDKKTLSDYTKRIETMLIALESAESKGETDQFVDLQDELDEFIEDLKKSEVEYETEGYEIKKVTVKKFKDNNYECARQSC